MDKVLRQVVFLRACVEPICSESCNRSLILKPGECRLLINNKAVSEGRQLFPSTFGIIEPRSLILVNSRACVCAVMMEMDSKRKY